MILSPQLTLLLMGIVSSICWAVVTCRRSSDHRANVTTICSTIEALAARGADVGQMAAALKAVSQGLPGDRPYRPFALTSRRSA